MFTECEAVDLKGLWEQEGGRESCLQALAARINPEGNQTRGHGVEEHVPSTSPARRARPRRGWLCAVLAPGAAARSPAEPSAHLCQISHPATSCIPKGRGLWEGNPIAQHPHLSHPWGISGRTCRKIQVSRGDLWRKSKGCACKIRGHFWGWGFESGALVSFGDEPWEDIMEISLAVTMPPGLQKGVSVPAEIGYGQFNTEREGIR